MSMQNRNQEVIISLWKNRMNTDTMSKTSIAFNGHLSQVNETRTTTRQKPRNINNTPQRSKSRPDGNIR